MLHGPSRCSITAKTPWRFDRLEFGEIEIDNRPQGLGRGAVLLIVGQRVQPGVILGLHVNEPDDGVIPSLDPAAPVGRTACADDGYAGCVRGTIAGLTFGAGHRCFTDRWTGHGSTPWCYVTKPRSCRNRPGGGWRAPVRLAARHHRPGHAGHLVGECHSGEFARLALEQRPQ